jgi:hypothetical protein
MGYITSAEVLSKQAGTPSTRRGVPEIVAYKLPPKSPRYLDTRFAEL